MAGGIAAARTGVDVASLPGKRRPTRFRPSPSPPATRPTVRLLLADRCALPPPERWAACLAELPPDAPLAVCLRGIRRLRDLGAEVEILAVDITDRATLQRKLAEARSGPRWLPIRAWCTPPEWRRAEWRRCAPQPA